MENTTPLFTPVATPPIPQQNWPWAVVGGVSATLATALAVGSGVWNIGDYYTAGNPLDHLIAVKKSMLSSLGLAPPGIFNVYAKDLWQLGWPAIWRVAFVSSSSIAVGIWVTWQLSRPVEVIRHHRGRRKVSASILSAIAQNECKHENGTACHINTIPISAERIARSVGILGSTGGGKTVTINQINKDLDERGYRLLIVDGPKGDFSSSDGLYLTALRIAPWHAGALWDIARDCRTRADAREFASRLIPVSDKEPLFGNAARFAFVTAVCYLIDTKGTNWGWGDLWDACALDIEALKQLAEKFYPPAVEVFLDAESKTTKSIIINFRAYMGDIYEIAQAWRDVPTDWIRFSFLDWLHARGRSGKQRHVIIQTSGEWQSVGRAFSNAVIGLLSQAVVSPTLAESKTRRIALVIDELGQLGRLDGIEKFLEIGRSKSVSAIFATQNPAQLRIIYGEDQLNSWFAMLGLRLYVRTLGSEDQEWVATQIGKREIDVPHTSVSVSANGYNSNHSYQRTEEWIIHPSELQKLGKDLRRGGITCIVDGFDDVAEGFVPFQKINTVRASFEPNPRWNIAHSLHQSNTQSLAPVVLPQPEYDEPAASHPDPIISNVSDVNKLASTSLLTSNTKPTKGRYIPRRNQLTEVAP